MKAGEYIHADVDEDSHVVVTADCSGELMLSVIGDLLDSLQRNTDYSYEQIVAAAQLSILRRRAVKQFEAFSKANGGDL